MRKAMGKKQAEVMAAESSRFIEGRWRTASEDRARAVWS